MASAVGGELCGDGKAPINGVVTDSRQARPGDLFVALDGAHTDGHCFLREVRAAGASGALVMPDRGERPEGFPCVVVPDTLEALAALARHHLGRLQVKVVGITGTVGKTTAKDMFAQVLGGPAARVHAAPASYNSECGLPLAILASPQESRVLVLEYGVNAPGEMARLLSIAKPQLACITALTPVHLEGMGSLEVIVSEKTLLAAAAPPDGVVWMPEEAAQQVPSDARWPARLRRTGFGPGAVQILHRQPGAFRVTLPRLGELTLPVYADHEVMLAAIAVEVGFELGENVEALRERVQDLRRPEGRLTAHVIGAVTVLDDAYNASPAAACAALEVLERWPQARRRIAVLGTMHELGAEAEQWHRELGRQVAAVGVDQLFGVGAGGAWIVAEAREAGIDAMVADDAEAVGSLLAPALREQDVVLLKASRAEGLERMLPRLCAAARALNPAVGVQEVKA
ncbi:MAG: UDP-N-acetylmuramoyl-tripeptide--D-alanyl-D-alanine ligase [Planctomycetes bacterium]|nr:UDP-N-acetylmuramoyl-tripeptide--D-alanyl-D-alanine ligase [Planctomycetota bacterium]